MVNILVTDVLGFESDRLTHELMHERVVNLKGGAGRNIPLDLLNEFMNLEFKGT